MTLAPTGIMWLLLSMDLSPSFCDARDACLCASNFARSSRRNDKEKRLGRPNSDLRIDHSLRVRLAFAGIPSFVAISCIPPFMNHGRSIAE